MSFPTTGGSSTTSFVGSDHTGTTWNPEVPYSVHPGHNMSLSSSSTPMTTAALVNSSQAMETSSSWTVDDLKILGVILWFVIVFTLVGNIACFYAVIKNLKVCFVVSPHQLKHTILRLPIFFS